MRTRPLLYKDESRWRPGGLTIAVALVTALGPLVLIAAVIGAPDNASAPLVSTTFISVVR